MEDVARFVKIGVDVYRVLLRAEDGVWLISCDEPGPPVFSSSTGYERIPTPDDFFDAAAEESRERDARFELIRPLLEDDRCITDREWRNAIAGESAKRGGSTRKRVLRLYYKYLATGRLRKKRESSPANDGGVDDFKWAIRTFYFSAKGLSLRDTYEMMILRQYSDPNGKLLPGAPSFSRFQHFFYRNGYHRQPEKIIARDGLTYYQRNKRPAFGTTTQKWPDAGVFQMDATIADIYLVLESDRRQVVGRPNIYLAVDSASKLIAGVYVGFDSGETAVMACISQAAGDKVRFCKRFGIDITPEQWPNLGMPNVLVTDKGKEFVGGRVEELAGRYGVRIENLPPFRPDLKGSVEKTFDLLQERYKPYLKGKGVIEWDAAERWAADYRDMAVLSIREFTQIILHCVLYLNYGRVLASGLTPAQEWTRKGGDRLLKVSKEELYQIALRRDSAVLTRRGFRFHNMRYVPEDQKTLEVGKRYVVAFDSSNVTRIFAVLDGAYIPCALADDFFEYEALTAEEASVLSKQKKRDMVDARQRELQASIDSRASIERIVAEAAKK